MTQVDLYAHAMDRLRNAALAYKANAKTAFASDDWDELLEAAMYFARARAAFTDHLDRLPIPGQAPDPKTDT